MSDQPPPPAPYGAAAPDETPPEPPSGLDNSPHRRGRIASTVALLGLVAALAGWAWFAGENAREGWWTFGQHVAVEPDGEGWASIDTVSVALSSVDVATEIDGVSPPSGYAYLVLDLLLEATETEQYRSCTVEVRDAEGRQFLAGREVPNGDPYSSELMCGTSDPAEEPVPDAQSTLVLVPVDAELVSVRVDSNEFPPATFIELPLPS